MLPFALSDLGLLKKQAFIDGQWVDAYSGETYEVYNPANQEIISHIACCGTTETAQAISAADRALKHWRKETPRNRSALLEKWSDLLIEHSRDLALILTSEQGKPLAEAETEIISGASYMKWFAEEAKRIYGDVINNSSTDKRLLCIKQPVGVVACITPWNFPNAMLARKIAPALAAGCTVVCKPANVSPLSAMAMAELGCRAGLPKGVVNILSGHTEQIGLELTSNPVVRKLTFTGSTEVGKKLMANCAGTMKRISMELGGNAPFIVFDDADLDAAISGLMDSKFRNAGQTCICANRVLVHDSIYEQFLNKFSKAVSGLVVGSGGKSSVDVGPLIDPRAAESVHTMIDKAVDQGADIVVGNLDAEIGPSFVTPTVLKNVTPAMEIAQEEIFGPVAPIIRFYDEEEAIEIANNTPYGLAAYFYTRDIGRIWRVSEDLEYGMLGVNAGLISSEESPFGGIKESGQGREGSKYGLDDYLEIKSLCMGGIGR